MRLTIREDIEVNSGKCRPVFYQQQKKWFYRFVNPLIKLINFYRHIVSV